MPKIWKTVEEARVASIAVPPAPESVEIGAEGELSAFQGAWEACVNLAGPEGPYGLLSGPESASGALAGLVYGADAAGAATDAYGEDWDTLVAWAQWQGFAPLLDATGHEATVDRMAGDGRVVYLLRPLAA